MKRFRAQPSVAIGFAVEKKSACKSAGKQSLSRSGGAKRARYSAKRAENAHDFN